MANYLTHAAAKAASAVINTDTIQGRLIIGTMADGDYILDAVPDNTSPSPVYVPISNPQGDAVPAGKSLAVYQGRLFVDDGANNWNELALGATSPVLVAITDPQGQAIPTGKQLAVFNGKIYTIVAGVWDELSVASPVHISTSELQGATVPTGKSVGVFGEKLYLVTPGGTFNEFTSGDPERNISIAGSDIGPLHTTFYPETPETAAVQQFIRNVNTGTPGTYTTADEYSYTTPEGQVIYYTATEDLAGEIVLRRNTPDVLVYDLIPPQPEPTQIAPGTYFIVMQADGSRLEYLTHPTTGAYQELASGTIPSGGNGTLSDNPDLDDPAVGASTVATKTLNDRILNQGNVLTTNLNNAVAAINASIAIQLDDLDPQRNIGPADGYVAADSPITALTGEKGDWVHFKEPVNYGGTDYEAGVALVLTVDSADGNGDITDWVKSDALGQSTITVSQVYSPTDTDALSAVAIEPELDKRSIIGFGTDAERLAAPANTHFWGNTETGEATFNFGFGSQSLTPVIDESELVFPVWSAERAASGYWDNNYKGCRRNGHYYVLSDNARNKRLTDAPQATQRLAITSTDYGNYIYQATANDFFYWTGRWNRWTSPSGTKFVHPDEIVVPPDPSHDPASGTTSWKKVDFITAPALRTLDPDKISVKNLGAKGNGNTDSAAMTAEVDAINATIRLAADERLPVYIPPGSYCLNAPVQMQRGTIMKGAGSWGDNFAGNTRLIGIHNGNAVVEFYGVQRTRLEDIHIVGDTTTQPLTGISLGRRSAASAGQHIIENVTITGAFGFSCIYSQASEETCWRNIRARLMPESTGDYVFTTAQDDLGSRFGYVGSSNLATYFSNFTFSNGVDRPSAAVIFMHVGGGTKSTKFENGYLVSENGSALEIFVAADGQDGEGPITFDNVSGERGTVGPLYGVYLRSSTPLNLRRLNLIGWNFYQGTRPGSYTLYGNDKLTLVNSKLDIRQSATDLSVNGVEVEAIVNTVIESDETVLVRN